MSSGTFTRAGTVVREDEVVRYTFRERVGHWINGAAYSYLLASGLALFTPFLYWLAAVLGGGGTIRFWHPWIGLVYMATIIWMHWTWRGDMRAIPEDKEWTRNIRAYVENHDEAVPPQERFNAGQKQFWWVMLWCSLILLITGTVMWFPEKVPYALHWVLTLCVFIHSAVALITIGAFIIHVYMSIWMTPGSMKAMTEGRVSARWARAHHRLWYERIAGRRN
jgi:formate dehydrogenase subunit gamma